MTAKLTKSRAWRRFLRNASLRAIACWIAHCYIRLIYLTNRWSIEGVDWPRRLTREGRTFIVAFWHGRLLMVSLQRMMAVALSGVRSHDKSDRDARADRWRWMRQDLVMRGVVAAQGRGRVRH